MLFKRTSRSIRRLMARLFIAGTLCWLAVGCAPTGIYHVVEPGQTLYRIARAYNVDEGRLARVNNISDPTRLEAGQRLFVPGATYTRSVDSVESARPAAAKNTPPPEPRKTSPAPNANTVKKRQAAPKAAAEPDAIPGVRPAPGTFVWPVRGSMVTEFGAADGKSSKGIEIAVPHGTPVTAAAAGKVIYSGNGIRGYGNLIILEHADSYFTVYGFNAKNLVAVDSFVGQGDRIALSGAPSGGKSPRLHFEIRKGKTAVNPIFFLP